LLHCPDSSCFDVLVDPNSYFCDLIFTGLPGMPRLGKDIFSTGFDLVPGGNFHVVRALHRLGISAGWPCEFGSDIFSRFVLEAAREEGIDPRLFQVHEGPQRSLSVSLSFPHDRGFISYSDPFPPVALIKLLKEHRPRFFVLMCILTGEEMAAIGTAAREIGTILVVDPQSHEHCLDKPEVREALKWADVFLPNLSEVTQLTDQASPEAALDLLAEVVPCVAIKLGAEGAIAQAGTQRVCVPALAGLPVIDTTGAGDCFDAGFLYGLIHGTPITACLQYGNICGGLSVTHLGSEATPTEAHMLEKHQEFYT
jgi:sugar/nucleoside kinase (ribokinase family)